MRFYLVSLLALAWPCADAGAQVFVQPKGDAKKDAKANDKGPKDETPPKTSADTVGGKSLSEWEADLKSADPSRRAVAVMAIMAFGEQASRSVPLLIDRLSDDDVSPRAKACFVLRMIAVDEKHVRAVVKALATRINKDTQAIVRYEAAVTLRRFADDAGPAIPALIHGLTDGSSWEIRHVCAAVLWRAALDPKEGPDETAVRAMVGRLRAVNFPATYQEKLELIIGLGSMGRPKSPVLLKDVIVVLQQYAHAPAANVPRALALWAYAGLAGMSDEKQKDAALAAIVGFTAPRGKTEIRVQALGALAAFGPRSKRHVPELIKMLDDKDAAVASASASALSVIGTAEDFRIVDAFVSMLSQNAVPKADATALEKAATANRAGTAVMGLVGLKANHRDVHAAMDKLRDDKELDAGLRYLIEQGQKRLREPPKEPEKKENRVERRPPK